MMANKDRLDKLWERQREFESQIVDFDKLDDKSRQEWTEKFILHLVTETSELLDHFDWRTHRQTGELIKPNVLEELVDIFKFVQCVCLTWGISADDFFTAYNDKSNVVEHRWRQGQLMKDIGTKEKVCAIDIDGVLAQYPDHWISYLNKHLGTEYVVRDVTSLEFLLPQLDYTKYRTLKKQYRETGMKREIPAVLNASEMTAELSNLGYTIVLLTARPYDKYSNIYSDTLAWLDSNNIIYDAILWSKEKHKEILKFVPHLEFMVEDDPVAAMQIANLGKRVYLRNRFYNQAYQHDNIVRIDDLLEISDSERLRGVKL